MREHRSYSIGVVLMLVLSSVLFLSITDTEFVGLAEGTTYYVGGGGAGNYSSIQGAINAASDGDTIYVYNNVYVENLNINKRLTLIGQDKMGTIIDGNGADVVYIQSDHVNISSFTITNGGSGRGVYIFNSDNVRVDNNIINWNTDGVLIYYDSNYNVIKDNHIHSNSAEGVELNDDCYHNKVKNNLIDNNGGNGILLTYSNLYNDIENNWVNNSYIGVYLYNGNTDNGFISNRVTNNTYYGIYFWSGNMNNLVYDNIFAENVNQVYDDGTNNWYKTYPVGGNYWDEHSTADQKKGSTQSISGNDGISDTSYLIPGGSNMDKYPLSIPWDHLYYYRPAPGSGEVCEYAMGSVKVGVIFVESNGTTEPESEDWDTARMSTVLTEIQDALDWWEVQNANAGLSFSKVNLGLKNTSYEPITHVHTDEPLWVNEIMDDMGYDSGNYVERVRDHNDHLRTTYSTDWAFTIFAIDSLNDPDGYFADPNWTAWAYWEYGSITLTYDNGLWGISRMNNVTAHEIGHMFYATDEYNGKSEHQGYLDQYDSEGSGKLMDTNNLVLSTGTELQIGWRDGDSDGIMDELDTLPNTFIDPPNYTDITEGDDLYYEGKAAVVPYQNQNPKGTGRDVTINTITNVQYRIDSGTWQNAVPEDGAFDEEKESYNFTITSITSGTHLIETRAINNVGNVDTTPANDTVDVAGIQSITIQMDYNANSSGWRYISFNITPATDDFVSLIEDPYNGIDGSYSAAMWYDAKDDRWRSHVPSRASHFNDLKRWNNTMGMWIQMNQSDVLTVNGTEPTSTTIKLYPGWNMVGFPASSSMLANDTLPSQVTKIGIFDDTQEYNIAYYTDLTTVTMTPNRAYWIYNGGETAVDWVVS